MENQESVQTKKAIPSLMEDLELVFQASRLAPLNAETHDRILAAAQRLSLFVQKNDPSFVLAKKEETSKS